jgi:hypothetical protein
MIGILVLRDVVGSGIGVPDPILLRPGETGDTFTATELA